MRPTGFLPLFLLYAQRNHGEGPWCLDGKIQVENTWRNIEGKMVKEGWQADRFAVHLVGQPQVGNLLAGNGAWGRMGMYMGGT